MEISDRIIRFDLLNKNSIKHFNIKLTREVEIIIVINFNLKTNKWK